MQATFIVTRATMSDLNVIASLFDKYRQFYEQQPDIEKAKAFMEERLTMDDSVVFIAKERDNLEEGLGFTQLYPSFSSVSMEKIWILNDLYVESKARKAGVARLLMKEAESFAAQTRAKSVVLKTAKNNEPARHLYQSLGYQKDEAFDHYGLDIHSKTGGNMSGE